MSLEYQIKKYIQKQDWDITYNHSTVKNVWGTEWDVDIERSEDCMQIPGITYPSEKKIVLREPCDRNIAMTLYESKGEDMAYTLAHELGHADTWGISAISPYLIMALGITAAVKTESGKPLAAAMLGVVASKTILDELLAETAATVFHNTPFLKGLYLCLPDPVGMYHYTIDQISNFF